MTGLVPAGYCNRQALGVFEALTGHLWLPLAVIGVFREGYKRQGTSRHWCLNVQADSIQGSSISYTREPITLSKLGPRSALPPLSNATIGSYELELKHLC